MFSTDGDEIAAFVGARLRANDGEHPAVGAAAAGPQEFDIAVVGAGEVGAREMAVGAVQQFEIRTVRIGRCRD